jgi:hypothetical protein
MGKKCKNFFIDVSASVHNSNNSELYIEKAPLHIGVIVHQIKKYIGHLNSI